MGWVIINDCEWHWQLPNSSTSLIEPEKIAQSTEDSLVINYIITGMLPLRTVVTECFRDLVNGLAHDATIMTRVTLNRKLNNR